MKYAQPKTMKNKTLAINVALQVVIAGLLAIAHPSALYVDAAVLLATGGITYMIWATRR